MNSKNILVGAILVCVSVLGGFFGASLNKSESVGGLYNTNPTHFYGGMSAGDGDEFTVSSAGAIALTGALTGTTGAFTGAVSGTTGTFTGFGKFGSTASSTLQIGAASKSGCLILGDSANGANVVYIIATGSTITASTSKPAACQTVQ